MRPTKTKGPLQPAPLRAGVAAVACRLPRALRLAAMSWTYPGWVGLLYAPGSPQKDLVARGLPAYAAHPLLRAVEIERTFYRPIPASLFAEFAAQVPPDFRFITKAHQACTKPGTRFLDPAYATDRVVGPCQEGLGEKAAAILFQFGARGGDPGAFAEKLHRFLAGLPKDPLYAVELRDPKQLTPAYLEALLSTGAVHCHSAHGQMPSVLAQREFVPPAARKVLLARWVSRPGDSDASARERFEPFDKLVEEDPQRRSEFAALIRDALAEKREVLAIVSNKAEGCGPLSLEKLAESVAVS